MKIRTKVFFYLLNKIWNKIEYHTDQAYKYRQLYNEKIATLKDEEYEEYSKQVIGCRMNQKTMKN